MTMFDVFAISQKFLSFVGGHFWKYKPPRGAAGDKSRVFGNPNSIKKAMFENSLVDVVSVFKVRGAKFQFSGTNVDAVSNKIVSELIVWRSGEIIDICWTPTKY